jgi:glucose/arabinose dehydrogenase
MRWLTGLALIALAACGESASLQVDAGTGTDPRLPAPARTLLPTVNIARATGWGEGETPVAAAGYSVSVYAANLDHPRWLYRLPNGDVLVAETNKPAGMSGAGVMGWIEGKVMERAGAGVPSANRITLLRDANGDGVVDTHSAFLTRGLASPFGMALVGDDFYVANFREVRRYAYTPDATAIAGAGTKVVDLPVEGDKAGHWTRNLLASRDGRTLYVAVGSVSNAGENGMAVEADRAAIHAIDLAARAMRPFAAGLRNPVGMDWNPVTGELWTVVNERDMLGSDLVPDYMTRVRAGEHFGWPWVYFGDHRDARAPGQPPRATFSSPDYALGPHTASLGLAFAPDGSGAYVGQHGSWNRRPRSGYKVVFVPFADGRPAGKPRDVLTGFLAGDDARGRPVGVAFDRTGALLVADDVGNRVWRVSGPGLARAAKPATAAQ